MNEVSTLASEDDVRTKIVLPWLIGHGFNLSNVSVEYSFSIRLGRSVFRAENGNLTKESSSRSRENPGYSTFNPRADVLVRNNEGKNLLIIEVKAPNEALDNDARDQGVSYARLLLDGNIAPFVVLTNGYETRVFDSITKDQVDDLSMTSDHPCFTTSFCISGEDLSLRAEALQTLISLSPNNLIAFCEAQSAFRMRPLRSDELNSGKKYVPSLYIEREEAKSNLLELLDNKERRVVVLIGPPQVGKTNFICHIVEERLKQGLPCLFYPAIGVRRSLFSEIAEDFEWVLGDVNDSHQFMHRKLRNILSRSGKRLVIFIDGWNETNIKLARIIDHESERLSCDEIQIVITLTHVAASRLLGGAGGNPSFIAEAAFIPSQAAQLIEIDPEANGNPSNWSMVNIKRYSDEERERAYTTYAQAYNVKVPITHRKVYEPYSLGAAMRLFQEGTLPDTLDEPDLLERIINDKANRAVGLDHYNIRVCLSKLAEEMLISGSPVGVETVSALWRTPIIEKIPASFFESALLAQVTNEHNLPSIDFYYGKERDYIIAYWVQNWLNKLEKRIDVSTEFIQATYSNAGLDALRWFFRQPKHIKYIQLADGTLPKYGDALVRRILLSSLCDIASRYPEENRKWLEYAADQALHDNDNLVKIEAAKLVALLADEGDDLLSILEDGSSLKDFIAAILSVNEEYPFQEESAGRVILDAIRTIHWDSCDQESDESEITDVLNDLMHHSSSVVREGAASCFGNAAPRAFLDVLADEIKVGTLHPQSARLADYESGIALADAALGEIYYGSMCPGWLESLREDTEALREEYEKMRDIIEPIISVYPLQTTVQGLIDILEDLCPQDYYSENDTSSRPSLDKYTLPLPFDETEKESGETS